MSLTVKGIYEGSEIIIEVIPGEVPKVKILEKITNETSYIKVTTRDGEPVDVLSRKEVCLDSFTWAYVSYPYGGGIARITPLEDIEDIPERVTVVRFTHFRSEITLETMKVVKEYVEREAAKL